MAPVVARGKYYSYDGTVIDFYGAQGKVDFFGPRDDEGQPRWIIGEAYGPAVTVPAGSIMPRVQDRLADCAAAGSETRAAQIQIGRRAAVMAVLEGVLTAEHLAGAAEAPHFIDIPAVPVSGRVLTVRVLAGQDTPPCDNQDYVIAVADASGNVLA